MADTKHCPRCDTDVPVSGFQKCASHSDGLQTYCRVCRAGIKKVWRDKNRDRLNAQQREYYEANKDAKREYYLSRRDELMAAMRRRYHENVEANRETARQYARDNSSKAVERARKWVRENPDAARAHGRMNAQRRKARKLAAFVEDVEPLVVLERDDGACGICGRDVDPFDFHVDHIIPLARGGEHSYANVQAAHPRCNARKHVDFPEAVA